MATSDFRETLATVDQRGNRRWVYPTVSRGYFFFRRQAVAWVLIVIYLIGPWVTINGRQAIWLNIPERRFAFLGMSLWVTDTFFLFLFLAILAFSLFFFTALLGRVWCGWACPETVFLEFVFRPFEELFEGRSATRRRRDSDGLTPKTFIRKVAKWAVFSFISWIMASSALAYFVGREPLLVMMQSSPVEHPGPFAATLAMMGVVLFQFGWFREQFCTVLCPYARFQSVLLDQDSLLVGYDKARGEPRGKPQEGRGDCIDCGACVRTCPTGIDIRNGLQLECIQCAQCADACDAIMVSIGKPQGLVRYSTERLLESKEKRILRPRVVAYAILLVALIAAFGGLALGRKPVDIVVLRQGTDSPWRYAEGLIVNHRALKVLNKGSEPASLTLMVEGNEGVEVITPVTPYPVAPGAAETVPFFLRFDPSILHDGHHKVSLKVHSTLPGLEWRFDVVVFGPDKRYQGDEHEEVRHSSQHDDD